MTANPFTIIDNGQSHEIASMAGDKSRDSILRLATEPTLEALGWTQKSGGAFAQVTLSTISPATHRG